MPITRIRTLVSILIALLVLAAGGCAGGKEKPRTDNAAAVPDNAAVAQAGAVLCTINGEAVGPDEFQVYLDLFVPKEQRNVPILRKAFLGLINNRLLAKKASEEKLDADPGVRGKVGLSVNKVWEDVYWNEVVRPTVKITDDDVRRLAPPFKDSIRLFQIVAADPAKAEAARDRIVLKGESFEAVARAESEGLTAKKGGEVGYINAETTFYPKPVIDNLFAMKPGAVSRVVPTDIGYSVFKVTEVKTAARWREEWVKANRDRVLLDKAKDAWDVHLRGLKKKHRVVVHEAAGRKVVAALDSGKGVGKHAATVLVEVDGAKWAAGDLLDPSGLGVVHSPSSLDKLVDSRLREHLVNMEMGERGMKEKHPLLMTRERLLREYVLAREVVRRATGGIRVTAREIEAYYKANPSKFVSPRMLNVSVIEVSSEQDAKAVYRDLESGKSFAETADALSINRKLKGGSIGWVAEKSVAPRFAAVKRLKAGEHIGTPLVLTDPKTKKTTYAVLRLDDVRPEAKIPFSKVNRTDIESAVAAWKSEDAIGKIFRELKEKNKVDVDKGADELIVRFKIEPRKGGTHAKPHP